ncbi:MAG: SemiSWEET transporter [Ignavibacteriaceae bacterium]|nr:SemiSWEET transporter [Ignavibacteriaceae bacterium]
MRGKITDFQLSFKIKNFVIWRLVRNFDEYLKFFYVGFKLTGDLIGYIAAFCTTIAYVPQAIKVYKTKRTNDISIGTFLLLSTGVALWLVYGIIIVSFPIIAANAVTFILSLYIFIMKMKLDFFKPAKAAE